jgi:peptidoglycan/LPS O-acetylase OafA/YrhL
MSTIQAHADSSRFAELDGLRALAVIAVILFHCEIAGVFNAGFFGVDMFFTISGFIITSMLLREYRSDGDFRFLNFYFRRLKRLLPPVLALILIAFLGTAMLSRDALGKLVADTPAAFLYVSNWWQIVDRQDYFDTTPHVLKHLWSLAIEEQFYIVLPPLVYVILKRDGPRAAGVVAAVGAVASTAWMGHLYVLDINAIDQNRIYLGTDTHATGLLAGTALACFWNPWQAREVGRLRQSILRAAAVAALGGIGLMATQMNTATPWLYRGAFLVVPVLTCVVAYGTMGDRAFFLSALLRHPVVQWLGLRSYSLYLTHWLVFVWMRLLGHKDFSQFTVLVPALGISLGVSALMYRWVEQPARRFDLPRRGNRPKLAVVGGYAIIALSFSVAITLAESRSSVEVTGVAPAQPALLQATPAPMALTQAAVPVAVSSPVVITDDLDGAPGQQWTQKRAGMAWQADRVVDRACAPGHQRLYQRRAIQGVVDGIGWLQAGDSGERACGPALDCAEQ